MSTTQYRAQKSLAKDERRALDVARAKSLREDGLSLNEIAREMGFANDSSVRSLLNERSEARMNQAKKTAEFLKEQIAEKGMIDVGTGVERELGISKEKLKEALAILEAEGYPVYGGRIQQATNPGKHTTLQVVCPPGTEHKEIYDYDNIHSVKDYISYDDGESFRKSFVYPESMDSSRLKIRYAEDGESRKTALSKFAEALRIFLLENLIMHKFEFSLTEIGILKGWPYILTICLMVWMSCSIRTKNKELRQETF